MIKKKIERFILKIISISYLKFSNIYLNYFTYSKNINLSLIPSFNSHKKNIGIIIQGGIVTKHDFTVQTIKLYKTLYPNVIIVLSTWKGLNKETLDKLKLVDGIHCIYSEQPLNKGVKNVNLQIKSTLEAINYLDNLGCKHIMKSRTDQRFASDFDFIDFFLNLNKVFSLQNSTLKERLIISSLNTLKKRFYGISDMFMFGTTVDMKFFWDLKYDQKEIINHSVEDNEYFIKNEIAEGFLILNFMKKVNFVPKWTRLDSNHFLTKYFLIVDYELLNHFWLKYHWWSSSIKMQIKTNQVITFADWLKIKNSETQQS